MPNTAPDGFEIPFAAGHVRRMPRLTAGPFRYRRYADSYLESAQRYATRAGEAGGHLAVRAEPDVSRRRDSRLSRARQFIEDLLREHETEMRRCLDKGAHKVQIDFTEGRLAMKIDPSGDLLNSFIDLNNLALARFSRGGARSASAFTPARAAIAIRPTARMSTTRSCCRACSS